MSLQETLIEQFTQWARVQSAIRAVALVGSWARGAAQADSDVDLVIAADVPQIYLDDDAWVAAFGRVQRIEHEDWGLVQSKRVFYAGGLEVEFGLTTLIWTQTQPLDPGTAAVVRDGMKILYDPEGRLQALQSAVDAA